MSETTSLGPFDAATWVDEHGDFLFRYAVARLSDPTVAEDLVQETFVAALRDRRSFEGRASVRTWFVGILKHKIVDHLRRRGRERPVSAVHASSEASEELFDNDGWWQVKPTSWPTNPSQLLENKEFWETFRLCLEKLPQRMRAIFSLREMDELPTDLVCETMNVTPGNLGVLLHRARMGLRRCLEVNWFSTETREE